MLNMLHVKDSEKIETSTIQKHDLGYKGMQLTELSTRLAATAPGQAKIPQVWPQLGIPQLASTASRMFPFVFPSFFEIFQVSRAPGVRGM